MRYINLKNMKLSEIILGTDGYSERIDKYCAYELIDTYMEFGGNVLDTARLYCGGKSEELIGRFLRERKCRENLIISTKCSHPPLEDMSHSRLDKNDIEEDIDKSLIALGIDCIDILWLHRDDKDKPVEPIIDALNHMIKKGKIRYFGASNWRYDRIDKANNYAQLSNQEGFCASQALYNMATCTGVWDNTLVSIEGKEKEKYDMSHFPVFAFCSQAKGFFEKYNEGKLSKKSADRYLNDRSVETFKKIKEEAAKSNATISYTALKMLREQSNFDVFPIIGPTNINQLKSTLNL